jgi:hypothetical protein
MIFGGEGFPMHEILVFLAGVIVGVLLPRITRVRAWGS